MGEQPSTSFARTVIRVFGTLDSATVRVLKTRLDQVAGHAVVILELGATREVDHVALSMLAQDLARRERPRVVLQGLCAQHVRLLRYFGFDVAESQRAAAAGGTTATA